MDRRKLFGLLKSKTITRSLDIDDEDDTNGKELASNRIKTNIIKDKNESRKYKREKLLNANRCQSQDATPRNTNNNNNNIDDEEVVADPIHMPDNTVVLAGQEGSETTRVIASSTSISTSSKPTTEFHFAKPTIISATRSKLVELWRKQRLEMEKLKDQRPVFKVFHLDTKAPLPQLPQSSTFNFKMTLDNISKNSNVLSNRTITRSHTRKDLAKPNTTKTDYFANVKYEFLNKNTSLKLSTAFKQVPKSSSTSSLSSRQFMPLPSLPDTSIINNHAKKITTRADSTTIIESSLEAITNGIEKNVCLTTKIDYTKNFRPSLSSTIYEHRETEVVTTKIDFINLPVIIDNNDLPAVVDNTDLPAITNNTVLQAITNDNDSPAVSITDIPVVIETTDTNAVIVNTPNEELHVIENVSNHPNPIDSDLAQIAKVIEEIEQVKIEDRDVEYYRELVQIQTRNLEKLSEKYLSYCKDEKLQIPSDIEGDIRSASGLANLLSVERFNQFIELIDQCEYTTVLKNPPCDDVKLVTCSDLQGFWDMVDFQIKDVKKKFDVVEKLKQNNFKPIEICFQSKKATATAKPKTTSAKLVKARSSALKDLIAQKKRQAVSNTDDVNIEIVVEPIVSEPLKRMDPIVENEQTAPTPKRNGLLSSVLLKSANKFSAKTQNCHATPSNENITPEKSTKPYNLRSRPSDLMKFESPCRMCTPPVKKTLPPKKSISTKENMDDENVEDENEDLFSFMKEPSIKPRFKIDRSEEDKFADISNNLYNTAKSLNASGLKHTFANTPDAKTPIRCTNSGRNSLQPGNATSLANSPLLKMCYISSHGKRASISSYKHE